MHTLIQEMGREFVREESVKFLGQHSRLWDPEEVHDVGIFNKPYKIPNEHQNTLRQIIKRF